MKFAVICSNCSHGYKSHILLTREESNKMFPDDKNKKNKSVSDIPWVCVKDDCECRKYFPIRI